MIVQGILDILFGVITIVLGMLPITSFAFDLSSLGVFFDIITSVNYVIPLSTALQILFIVIGLQVFRIVVALVKLLWDVIPFA